MKTRSCVALALAGGVVIGALAVQGLHAQAKPPVYYLAQVTVNDPANYVKEFLPKTQSLVKAKGGRFLVAGGKVTGIEGAAPKGRLVVQVWDSMDKLQAWWDSQENKDIRKIGEKYATFRSWAGEGVAE
jgi:uncharacterized protein (DUF1330 family)